MILNLIGNAKFGAEQILRIYHGKNVIWSKIPNDYTECEYLESDAQSYIETDIVPRLGLWLEIKCDISSLNTGTLISAEQNSGASLVIVPVGKYFYAKYFTEESVNGIVLNSDQAKIVVVTFSGGEGKYEILLGDGTIKTNTEEVAKTKAQTSASLWLFKRQKYTSMGKAKIYYVRSPDFFLIPCLDASKTPCFYDAIGLKTYYNSGTGSFSYKIKE